MNIMIALARRCKVCKRWVVSDSHNYDIESIDAIDDFPMDQVAITEISHCGHSSVGTHVAIKLGETETQYQPLNTSDMPIGGITYSAETVALMDEGAKEQLAFWKANKDSLLEEYWLWLKNHNYLNKVVNEIKQKEFEEAFLITGISFKRILHKNSGIQVYRRFNESDQKLVFITISEAMITNIVWAMSAMEWPINEWKKYGKTRILWPVLYMPLNDALIGMRISAAARLGIHLDDSGVLGKRIITLEKSINRCNDQVTKLTDMLSQRQVEITQLETRLAETYAANRQLTEALDKAKAELKTVISAPTHKWETMKALIREMRDQLKRYEQEDLPEGPAQLQEENSIDVTQRTCSSLSSDIKIGIIGGWRREQSDIYPNIMTSPGLELVGFERVLRESDILVLLTKHVSHATMWFVKSYVAMEEEKPILYTTHLSIPIILEEVAVLAQKNLKSL